MPRSRRLHLLAVPAVACALALLLGRGTGAPPPLVQAGLGRGATVVLVHGLGSRPQHWLETARALGRDHRVVLVELPGHGLTRVPERFSYASAVESLADAIAHASPGPVVLVGHSVGGLIAAGVALEHPERVRRLVLVETALRPQADAAERERMLDLLEHDYDGLLRAAYGAFGRDSAQGEALYREVAALDRHDVARWIRLALTVDLSTRAPALGTPTLAVLAPHSWEPGERWADAARALGYSGARALEPLRLEDCGHFVMLDRPEALARAIARFAADLPAEPIAAAR